MSEEKIALLIDPFANVPTSWIKEFSINTIPCDIQLADEIIDVQDCTVEQVFSCYKDKHAMPTILPTTIEAFGRQFISLLHRGYKIIYLASYKPSNKCYKSVQLAVDTYPEKIKIIDTGNVSIGIAVIVNKVYELIKKEYSFEKIVSMLDDVITRSHINVLFPDDRMVLNKISTGSVDIFLSKFLGTKHCVSLCNSEAEFNKNLKGTNDICIPAFIRSILQNQDITIDNDILIVMHSGLSDRFVKLMKDTIDEKNTFKNVIYMEANCTAALNLGHGGIALAYFTK